MITVRFPSGVAVTYSDANDVQFCADHISICYKNEKGTRFWRAAVQLQAGCVIEWTKPCEVTASPLPSPDAAIDRLLELHKAGELRGCASWKLQGLKRALQRFNARSGSWG